MTVLINLLPHREEARKRKRENFFTQLALACILGAVASGIVWVALDVVERSQQVINSNLSQATTDLNKKIAEINRLKAEIASLEARRQSVEDLQADRNLVVHWMEDLARLTPEGLYLTRARQNNLELTVEGYALNNNQISQFMANTSSGNKSWITNSQWIGSIEAKNVILKEGEPAQRILTFSLLCDLVRDSNDGPNGNAGIR